MKNIILAIAATVLVTQASMAQSNEAVIKSYGTHHKFTQRVVSEDSNNVYIVRGMFYDHPIFSSKFEDITVEKIQCDGEPCYNAIEDQPVLVSKLEVGRYKSDIKFPESVYKNTEFTIHATTVGTAPIYGTNNQTAISQRRNIRPIIKVSIKK